MAPQYAPQVGYRDGLSDRSGAMAPQYAAQGDDRDVPSGPSEPSGPNVPSEPSGAAGHVGKSTVYCIAAIMQVCPTRL